MKIAKEGKQEGQLIPSYLHMLLTSFWQRTAAHRTCVFTSTAMAAVVPSSWRLLYENHQYTDLEFPSLNFSIRQGDVKDLPDDPEAAAFIVASISIQEVPEPESQTTRKPP